MSGSNRIGGAVKALAQTSGSLLVAQGLSALLTILVARHLGPKLVGDLALVYTTAAIASIGFNWGFDLWLHQALVARLGQDQHLVVQIIWIKTRLGLLLVPALAGLWWLFSSCQDLTPILIMAGLELVADGIVSSASIGFHSAGRHLQGSLLTVAQRILKLLAFLSVLAFGVASPSTIVAARLCSMILLVILFLPAWRERGAVIEQRLGVIAVLRASSSFAVLSGSAMTYGQVDVMILGLLLPHSEAVGQYSQALNMLASMMLLPYAAYLVFVRRTAAMVGKGDRPTLFKEYRLMFAIFGGIGLVLAFICVVVAPWLIHLLLGDAFLASSQLVSLQAVTAILKSVNLGLAVIMIVSYIQKPRIIVQLLSVATNIGLNLLFIPMFYERASVGAYTISEAVLTLGYAYVVCRQFRSGKAAASSGIVINP